MLQSLKKCLLLLALIKAGLLTTVLPHLNLYSKRQRATGAANSKATRDQCGDMGVTAARELVM